MSPMKRMECGGRAEVESALRADLPSARGHDDAAATRDEDSALGRAGVFPLGGLGGLDASASARISPRPMQTQRAARIPQSP